MIDAGRIGEFHRGSDHAESQARRTEPRHARLLRQSRDLTRVFQRRGERLVDEQRLVRGNHRPRLLQVYAPIRLSSSTASTFVSSVGMSGTISTPYLRPELLGDTDRRDWRSPGYPCCRPCTRPPRARRPCDPARSASPLSILVNAGTCEVSVPIMPTRDLRPPRRGCRPIRRISLSRGHCTLG